MLARDTLLKAYRHTKGSWSGISAATLALLSNDRDQGSQLASSARKAGMRILVEQADAHAYLELSTGNPLTIGQEVAAKQFAQFDWTLKANVSYLRRVARI